MKPSQAAAPDSAAIMSLRDEAARWIQSRCAQGWMPGEVPLPAIEAQVTANEWFVFRDPLVVAAVRLVDSDPQTWGELPTSALYVHGLVVARERAGLGLGRLLLRWSEAEAVRRGRRCLRLDCGDENTQLQRYYEQQGYTRVGHTRFMPPVYSVVLYEKAVDEL
jgi:ribosomal protein S18 acetylase RimI-like enzyme